MKIVLEQNRMVIDEQGLDSIVGSFIVPAFNSLPTCQKTVKSRRRTKGRMKASTLIYNLINEIQ
jgi:hypothetical protein